MKDNMNKNSNFKSNKNVNMNDIICFKCKSKGHYNCKCSSSNTNLVINKTVEIFVSLTPISKFGILPSRTNAALLKLLKKKIFE